MGTNSRSAERPEVLVHRDILHSAGHHERRHHTVQSTDHLGVWLFQSKDGLDGHSPGSNCHGSTSYLDSHHLLGA